jgi:hypothetical protein
MKQQLTRCLLQREHAYMATEPADKDAAADLAPEADGAGEAVKTGHRPWLPPTFKKFDARLRVALAGADTLEHRLNLGRQCWTLMCRAWHRRTKSTEARSKWNWFRYAGAVIPVIAAGAGGSLVSHLHGTPSAVIGWTALIGGLIGAAISAVRPGVEYTVDVRKAAEFETLYWDIYTYAMTKLRTVSDDDFTQEFGNFVRRMEKIALISGGSTATPS